MRHLLSLADLESSALIHLVDRAVEIAGSAAALPSLIGKVIGIYFRVSSTRTRSAFSTAALRLGARIVTYGPADLQVVTGETLGDTSRVLSGYLDGLVIRTNESLAEMREIARHQDEMAVVNALSEDAHPTQALADLATLREAFGSLDGIHVLYLGEGNSTARSLVTAVARIPGMKITLVTPEGFGLPAAVFEQSRRLAAQIGSEVDQHHRHDRLPHGVDAVYTSRWQTMGVPRAGDWLQHFQPYSVTAQVMTEVSKEGTVFLHDLPAVRGQDVADEVLDGPRSFAWRQARYKMWSAMAVLEWCLTAPPVPVMCDASAR